MDAKTFILHNIIQALSKPPEVEFKCGDLVGPYQLVDKDEEQSSRVTITNFTGEAMSLEMESNAVTRRVQFTPSPLFANCVILQKGAKIEIAFTRDVMSNEPLRAILVADMNYRSEQESREKEKKHECGKCHVAKFNSLQNLKVHEELYCTRREMEVSSSDEKNLMLLPLAFADTQSLFVQQNANLNVPVIDLDEKQCAASPPNCSDSSSCSPKSSSIEPPACSSDKPFSCSCGVSFSNQRTFDAHKQFYCSHSTLSSGSGLNRGDVSRKVPEKCTQCDFQPVSSSQLAMHIRSAHQTTKTFTCLVCGYRAFSMRGVRTHMRSHASADAQRFKVNEPERASSRS